MAAAEESERRNGEVRAGDLNPESGAVVILIRRHKLDRPFEYLLKEIAPPACRPQLQFGVSGCLHSDHHGFPELDLHLLHDGELAAIQPIGNP